MHQTNIISEILAERDRQDELAATGEISFDCSDPEVSYDRRLRVLTEEVGEVAKAIDDLDRNLCEKDDLRVELLQVAAVAVAWLEAMEHGQDQESDPIARDIYNLEGNLVARAYLEGAES